MTLWLPPEPPKTPTTPAPNVQGTLISPADKERYNDIRIELYKLLNLKCTSHISFNPPGKFNGTHWEVRHKHEAALNILDLILLGELKGWEEYT